MDYGWMLLRMIGVLAAVCGLAWVLLRWGLKRLSPYQPESAGRLEVVEQLPVGSKRSLMVVRAGREYWLVGASESGLEQIGRLDPAAWQGAETEE